MTNWRIWLMRTTMWIVGHKPPPGYVKKPTVYTLNLGTETTSTQHLNAKGPSAQSPTWWRSNHRPKQ